MTHLPFLFSSCVSSLRYRITRKHWLCWIDILSFYYIASIQTFCFISLSLPFDCLTSIRAYRLHQYLTINNHDKTVYNPIFFLNIPEKGYFSSLPGFTFIHHVFIVRSVPFHQWYATTSHHRGRAVNGRLASQYQFRI